MHQPSSPLGDRIGVIRGAANPLVAPPKCLGLGEATPSQRLRVPDEFSGERDAQPNQALPALPGSDLVEEGPG